MLALRRVARYALKMLENAWKAFQPQLCINMVSFILCDGGWNIIQLKLDMEKPEYMKLHEAYDR